MKISLALLALLVLTATASADTVLTYTRNATSDPLVLTPNPCGCALDGIVTVATIIPSFDPADEHSYTPLSYSFSVNGVIFNLGNSTASFVFSFINGQVALWNIAGDTPAVNISPPSATTSSKLPTQAQACMSKAIAASGPPSPLPNWAPSNYSAPAC